MGYCQKLNHPLLVRFATAARPDLARTCPRVVLYGYVQVPPFVHQFQVFGLGDGEFLLSELLWTFGDFLLVVELFHTWRWQHIIVACGHIAVTDVQAGQTAPGQPHLPG